MCPMSCSGKQCGKACQLLPSHVRPGYVGSSLLETSVVARAMGGYAFLKPQAPYLGCSIRRLRGDKLAGCSHALRLTLCPRAPKALCSFWSSVHALMLLVLL